MTKEKKEMTPEERQADLADRVKKFNEGLIELQNKYHIRMGSRAFLNRNGTIGSEPVLVDTDNLVKEPGGEKVEGELAKPE